MIKVGRNTKIEVSVDSAKKTRPSNMTASWTHKHEVNDTDPHFIIDGNTRMITNAREVKVVLMQGDHSSERLTFEIPRYVDDHDISTCDVCQIHYLNVGSSKETNKGIYEVNDLRVDPDNPETVTLSWLISSNVTRYVGRLSFVIRFACSTDGALEYVWNTAVNSDVKVSSSIRNSDEVVMEYADILEEWRQKLFGTGEKIINITLNSDSWIASSDLSYFTQDISIPDSTVNTKIDLQPSPEQLVMLINFGITMFVANDNGDIKVYSVGDKPPDDIVLQATVKEVIV